MTLPGEKDAVDRAVAIASMYGFGNLIAHLKAAWRDKLMAEGLSEEAASQAADVSAYPRGYRSEEIRI